MERWFCEGGSTTTYADVLENLRKAHKMESQTVLDICRAHEQLTTTSAIVLRMLGVISDGTKLDLESIKSPDMGKMVSLVAGAESLSTVMPAVAEIGSLVGNQDSYDEVALRARKLLMQVSVPSVVRRREKILGAAKDIAKQAPGESPSREVQDLLADRFPIVDVLFSLLKVTDVSPDVSVGLLELYLRHLYRPYTIKKFERDVEGKVVKFSFLNKPAEGFFSAGLSMTSLTDLTRAVSSGSLSKHSDGDEKTSTKHTSFLKQERLPPTVERTGLCVMIEDVKSIDTVMPSVLARIPAEVPKSEVGPVNVLYLMVVGENLAVDDESENAFASTCEEALAPLASQLMAAGVRRVSFILDRSSDVELEESTPALLTFRAEEYKEDTLYRHIDPSLSSHLGLNRLSANFAVKSLGSRHTSACHVHLYECRPKPSALEKDKWAKKDPRVFARALSFEMDFSSSSFERILVDALNALDLCSLKNTSDNHLFLSLVSDFERNVLDPVVVEQIVAGVVKRHGHRLSALGLVEVEVRIVGCLSADSPPIAIRLFSSNPTGFVQVMNTYVEAASDTQRIYKLIGGTKASLAGTGDSSWDGKNVNTPYPLTRPFDAQRKAALRSSDTVYCYDLPALFEAAVEQQWQEALEKNESGTRNTSRPLMVMYTTELVVKKKNGASTPWTVKDYHEGNLELVQENRGAGHNGVGMVAWIVTLRTVECPSVSGKCSRSMKDNTDWTLKTKIRFALSLLAGTTIDSDCQ